MFCENVLADKAGVILIHPFPDVSVCLVDGRTIHHHIMNSQRPQPFGWVIGQQAFNSPLAVWQPDARLVHKANFGIITDDRFPGWQRLFQIISPPHGHLIIGLQVTRTFFQKKFGVGKF